jgi:hypothetical protein
MAVEFTGMERNTEYRFFPEDIEIRPELNGRHEKPDVEWLIADIMKHGQHTPVQIWNDGGTAVLAAGFSRWRAISEINKRKLTPKPLKLRCAYTKTNERGAFILNISENRYRNAVTEIDDAHNIARLINIYQFTEEEAAQVYYPTAKTAEEIKGALKFVRERLAMISLSPEAEEAVKAGRLVGPAAAAIAKLSSAQQREILKAHPEGRIKTKDIKPAKVAKPKKLKLEPELLRRITAVIETADFEKYDEKSLWIEVHAEPLAALKNYLAESI